jgi:radical SAM protein with 4Fe4S-binding SPASM domain
MSHRRLPTLEQKYFPAYVVWELTLRCDQACAHCGSRAGPRRPEELSTKEALGVVEQLALMKPKEVVLIGGEAYLHEGFLEIIEALTNKQIHVTMTTGGRGITPMLAKESVARGLQNVSVSFDGLIESHDLIRAAKGSFDAATQALQSFREAGITIASTTNLNRINQHDLEGLYEHLKVQGVTAWQLQITTPLGRAADRPQMLLQPWDLITLMPRIAALKVKAFGEGMRIMPGNNLGYFGPEEGTLRSLNVPGKDHWLGCQAGRFVMGIESNGAVKGCPSLQTASYVGGNLRQKTLDDIWQNSPQLAFTRNRGVEDLWGFCRTCPFAETCMGGCSFTAHSLFGRPGNNPYCHFRAKTLAKQNKRERLVLQKRAPGRPFDHALFTIVEEAFDALDLELSLEDEVRIRK